MLNYNLLSDGSYAALRYQLLLNVEETGNPKPTPYLGTTFYTMLICLLAFMPTSIVNASQQPKICADIHKRLMQQQQGHAPADFVVKFLYQDGGDTIYPRLDIDGDRIDDSVVRSCGAGINRLCSLFVGLSTGEKLELEDEEPFFLVEVKSFIYIVVGETSEKESDKRGKRKIYQLTKQAIKLICPHI